ARHRVWGGDFDGDGKSEALFHFADNGDWYMAHSDGAQLTWHKAGNTAGFGDLLDGGHYLVTGDFNGDHKTDVLMYYPGDGNWWMGLSDGNAIPFHLAGTTKLGNVLDGAHAVHVGDYDHDGRTDVLVYDTGSGDWNMGLSDGNAITWHKAGNTSGFGNL